MYVTRPRSLYLRNPAALWEPPPEGPGSGILVVDQDEEAESTCCFGLNQIRHLPFPQNVDLFHDNQCNGVILIPVLNKPISSSQYYILRPHGRHKGKALVSSRTEDMITCLCCRFPNDLNPAPLDPYNIYQQFIIYPYEFCVPGQFYAKSLAPDGHPPEYFGIGRWNLYSRKPKDFRLGEAPGIFDTNLRAQLPSLNVDICQGSSQPILMGRWYCPFMFVRDGALQDQVKKSRYYEMTLDQKWELIYACENSREGCGESVTEKQVIVDKTLKDTVISVGGKEAKRGNVVDGIMWFVGDEGERCGIGLSVDIVERMRWEEERLGWDRGDEVGRVRVKRVEESEDALGGEWKRFGCYMLVESFVLKRMDGSLVMSYGFRHVHQIRCKWE